MANGSRSWLSDCFICLRYDLTVAVPGGIWLSLLLVFMGLLLVCLTPDTSSQLLIEVFFIEALFPLFIGLISYRLILIDKEKQRIAFLRTRETLSQTWGRRLLSLMIVIIPSLGLMWLGWHFTGKSLFPFTNTLLAFGTSTLAMVSIGCTIAFLTQNSSIGDLILVFWWGFCFLSYRAAYSILGPLYLFPWWYSLRLKGAIDLQTSSPRWTLLGLSVVLLLVCWMLLKHED